MRTRLIAHLAEGLGDSSVYVRETARNTLEEESMTDQIERELLLPAPPQQVWEVITGPGWLASQVELELEPGGEARFADGDGTRTGWVEDAVEAERLVFWWSSDGDPASRVELTL